MRVLVLLSALAMPVVAALSQAEVFGPGNGAISNQYPTLVAAAGYAFSIWGVIFLLDLAFALWQLAPSRSDDPVLQRVRPFAVAGFTLTALWMPVFSMQIFWGALIVIWATLGALLTSAVLLSRASATHHGIAWAALSLHAGWLSLAAILNTAQVIVAYELLQTDHMLAWTLGLFAVAAALLSISNHIMRGNRAFAAAALWGLVGVYVKQSEATTRGSDVAASVALLLAALLFVQTAWLSLRRDAAPSVGR